MPEFAQMQTPTHILTIKSQLRFFYGRLTNFFATLAMNTDSRNFPGAIEQG